MSVMATDCNGVVKECRSGRPCMTVEHECSVHTMFLADQAGACSFYFTFIDHHSFTCNLLKVWGIAYVRRA